MILRRADFLPAALLIIVLPGACLAGLKGLPKLSEIFGNMTSASAMMLYSLSHTSLLSATSFLMLHGF